MEHRKTVRIYYRLCLTALFIFFSAAIYAQETDITGLWKGTLYNDTTQLYYQYEIGISKEKGKLLGFSHTWFILDDKQYYGVKKVKVSIANDGKIIIEDDGLIANNYPVPPNKNVRQLNILTLDATSSIMTLRGLYRTNRTKDFHVLTGSVSLQRENDFWQSALIPHLEELGKAASLSFLKADKEEKSRMTTNATAQEAAATAKNEKAAKKEEQEKLALAAAMEKAASEAQEAAEKFAKATELTMAKERKKEAAALAKQAELLAKKEKEAQKEAEKGKAKQAIAQQKRDADMIKVQRDVEIKANELVQKEATQKEATQKEALAKQAAEDAGKKTMNASASLANNAAEEKPRNTLAEQKKGDHDAEASVAQFEQTVTTISAKANHLAKPAAQVNERATIVQQTVSFTSDSLLLSLYDNGEVDGDTVSVLLNGRIVLEKQGLSTTAIKKTIYIPANIDRMELIMYAESLGAIPPNTGLLVIRDGKNLYEVRFSGDLQKNAAIVLNRKKE